MTTPDPLAFVVAALACYRVTLLVTADEITRAWRERLTTRMYVIASCPDCGIERCDYEVTAGGPQHLDICPNCGTGVSPRESGPAARGVVRRLGLLVDCPWCVSMYLAPPAVASALAWGDGWGWWLAAGSLAASAVTGALASYASP